ncbi:bifunctional 3'-5' exonuclease/DNA polymerase [Streptomyces thermolineatus]|uniref:bifunctional 3'-5' exonuclease/DNA polymerase n=2 Tax=Streptomyces TaxID=1883 RepID=UPI00384FD949
MAGERPRGGRVAVAADAVGPGGRLQELDGDGRPAGPAAHVPDLAAAVAEREAAGPPRWVWAATDEVYPRLLPSLPVRPARCHDVRLVEALLLGHQGRFGEPRSLGAAWARANGLPVPEDPPETGADDRPALFEADRHRLPPGTDPLAALVAVHAEQQRLTARLPHPDRMRLLCAAESAGALAAVEMGHDGLPWSARAHDELLEGLLGPRPAGGGRPARLAELAGRVQRALGGRPVNPDSPSQVLRAFAEQGVRLNSTRAWELREADHPAARLLLEYKELSRIHAAHGWAWREQWVRGGRFRPEYVVGGVVSGRWATRGGGALQIPRVLRGAVVADPGHLLVVADAEQLEPRVLAAVSEDAGLVRAAAAGDLYAALAPAFGGDRARAKVAVLGAVYGQTTGEAGRLLPVLRHRFPAAMALVEEAARAGETGGLVRSRLGRTCPPPSADVPGDGEEAGRAARSRGRFARNFVVQASAAEWALAMLAALRRRLAGTGPDGPRVVFFQHDEVMVHTPEELAGTVLEAVAEAGDEARRLVFGATPVRFPLSARAVRCYADTG